MRGLFTLKWNGDSSSGMVTQAKHPIGEVAVIFPKMMGSVAYEIVGFVVSF